MNPDANKTGAPRTRSARWNNASSTGRAHAWRSSLKFTFPIWHGFSELFAFVAVE